MTPALADANNGNWQTAHRWAGMLSGAYRVRLAAQWRAGSEALMIALHARRSATSIAAWREARRDSPLLLVMTGTDLYRDIDDDASAQASLQHADRIVVLNQLGIGRLPLPVQAKACVLLQSSPARQALAKTHRHLRALMVGHLREEKSPRTYFEAALRLGGEDNILLDHVGAALDPLLGEEARTLAARCPHYRWLGGLPHAATRRRIQAAHVLVQTSRMEGGAHVVIEAVRSGTAVLASRIDGNVGLLGEDYAGYFPLGDAGALASLLQRLRREPAMLDALQRQCRARAPLFDPARERNTLRDMVSRLLTQPSHPETRS